MSLMRSISAWGLIGTDQQTADWMAAARTPETRARIRRWSRIETIGVVLLVPGICALLAAPVVTLALAIGFAVAGVRHTDVYWWLWGVPLGLSVAGAAVMAVSSHRRLSATFADGHVAIGRVDRVVERPGSGDDTTTYELRVSAELSSGVLLRRKLYRDGGDPSRRIGRPIRFRHNTLDPDDVHDALFDGWPDDA